MGRRREREERKEGVRDDGIVGESDSLQLGKLDAGRAGGRYHEKEEWGRPNGGVLWPR